ncbi:hypothetical protein C8Q80DRAFT_9904 [Daedaleopsis nitida]|nr:hypothetical protein C8Q80DRAFT_9904 [Daedaleopsis nitida]
MQTTRPYKGMHALHFFARESGAPLRRTSRATRTSRLEPVVSARATGNSPNVCGSVAGLREEIPSAIAVNREYNREAEAGLEIRHGPCSRSAPYNASLPNTYAQASRGLPDNNDKFTYSAGDSDDLEMEEGEGRTTKAVDTRRAQQEETRRERMMAWFGRS